MLDTTALHVLFAVIFICLVVVGLFVCFGFFVFGFAFGFALGSEQPYTQLKI